MAKLVGKRYALALFETGLDLNKIDEFDKELDFIKSVFEEEEDLLKILQHPKIKKGEKRNLIDSIFKNRVSNEMINFLYIIIDKRRERYILDIVKEYKKLFNEHENIIEVVATTAVPMEEKSITRLELVLSNKLNKKVKLINRVDKTILGGVLLEIENKLIDGTVLGQLESIGKTIKGISL
ncbi:MAG: F0F1 ATP synthase subunit delta [Tissierellia bacterium]|nr:F0F1 ATP synthase subunit delta [Tissierellia bacterium]